MSWRQDSMINPPIEEIVAAYFTTLDAQEVPYPSGSVMAQHLVYRDVQTTGVRVLLGRVTRRGP